MLNVLEDKMMVNSINEFRKMRAPESDTRTKPQQQEHNTQATDSSINTDRVNLSNASKQLESLKALLKDAPEINEARVMYFKAEIESGQYQINSDKIAMGMLNNYELA